MRKVILYNPHDDFSTFLYAAVRFEVPANTAWEVVVPEELKGKALPLDIANHAVATCGMWGMSVLSGDEETDKKLIERAEAKYLVAMRAWCEDQVLGWADLAAPRLAAGLTPPDKSGNVLQAEEWLKKRGLMT